MFGGKNTVDIAAYAAANIFNDDYSNIFLMIQIMHLKIGLNNYNFCKITDERRQNIAITRTEESNKMDRQVLRAT